MRVSLNEYKKNRIKNQGHGYLPEQKHKSAIVEWLMRSKYIKEGNTEKMFRSQLILFNSRKKWGLLFALATVSGLFCVPLSLHVLG
jgi:hypothetical protein